MESPAATNWRPIGTVLVESGAITQADLDEALAEQRLSGRRLGEILIDTGRITWLQLAHGIAEQARDLEAASPVGPVTEVEVDVHVEPEPTISVVPDPEPEPAISVVPDPEPEPEPEPQLEPEPPATPLDESPAPAPLAFAPPVTPQPASAVGEETRSDRADRALAVASSDAAVRLETVETMLKERQRAFLELVSVTERLRATVSKLQDELAARDAEITRLRSRSVSA